MVFEKLTEKEIDQFENYLTKYFDYDLDSSSEDFNYCDCGPILSYWDTAKSSLYKLLGEKLILRQKIKITKPVTEAMDEIEDLIFSSRLGACIIDLGILQLFTSDVDIYSNVYTGPTITLTRPHKDDKILKIRPGTKFIHCVKKIAEFYNLEGYEEFRLWHSQILNSKNIEGTLCLSIHPMDYLTLSDNANDWDSCLSIAQYKEHRRGCLELLTSKNAIIAYLESNTTQMECGWNSKKWREIFIVDENILSGVKGYPFESSELENIIIEWLRELAKDNLGWEYSTIRANTKEYTVSRISASMYNDAVYKVTQTYLNPKRQIEKPALEFIGPSICICCGKIQPYFAYQYDEDLICRNCKEEIASVYTENFITDLLF